MDKFFLLRRSEGDQAEAAEAELRTWLENGQCRPADFLFDFAAQKWMRVGDHPALADVFSAKPAAAPDRRVIYFLAPGGSSAAPLGPFSTKEIQARAAAHEICANTWVFVEGDKEWRQVRNVKILHDMLPALPLDQPAPLAAALPPPAPAGISLTVAPASPSPELASGPEAVSLPSFEPEPEQPSMPSIKLDLGESPIAASEELPPPAPPVRPAPLAPPTRPTPLAPPTRPAPLAAPARPAPTAAPAPLAAADDEPVIEREEVTLALDTMGLNLHSDNFAPAPAAPPLRSTKPGISPAPPKAPPNAAAGDFSLSLGGAPSAPPAAPPKAKPTVSPGALAMGQDDHFDGIVAEIPMDPIWLVKQANGETVSGPFRFLEVIKFLEEGKLTKNDKIARTGNKAFAKIGQQYEFNVKFSIESVIENGQEKQKILIRRRHPRVPYITGVQVVSKHGLQAGQCVNISAGGILMEVPKAEFNLGEIIEVKILPGLIAKSISCKSLIIGKIPKIPPGYALKFEDLKPEDKEAIEYYVQETLKREMQKKN